MSATSPSAGSGVVVAGPPRSGTSATTRLLNLAGAQLCTPGDLLGGGPNNPTGHWESKTVLSINNRLLDAAGCRWWCPPPIGAEIDVTESASAADAFRAVHTSEPWLCKDPRFSFTLSFWRHALGCTPVGVVVVRRPDEVVASLQRTWPLSATHAAALWARYLLAALNASSSTGSTMAVRFPEVLDDPARLVSAVTTSGVALGAIEDAAVDDFVRTPRGDAGVEVADEIWELWHAVAPNGIVADATDVALPPEPESVERLLSVLRDDMRAGRPIDVRPHFARTAVRA